MKGLDPRQRENDHIGRDDRAMYRADHYQIILNSSTFEEEEIADHYQMSCEMSVFAVRYKASYMK